MTNDIERIKAKAAWQVLKDSPSFGGSGPQIGLASLGGSPQTLTSVAYTSAEVFDPTNIDAIKAFQESLKPVNMGILFLLADEPDNTAQAGIETTLPPKKVKLLADVEIAEREAQESHDRELAVVREQTKGSIWLELLKYGLPALVTFILTYFGLKGSG